MPYFDHEGWLVNHVIEGRFTEVPVPDGIVPADSNWNFTGYKWMLLNTSPVNPVLQVQVPQKVTRRQARQALLLNGKLDAVDAAIKAIPDAMQRAMVQIEWEDSMEFERQRPTLKALAAAIGLDDNQLDALFVQASKL